MGRGRHHYPKANSAAGYVGVDVSRLPAYEFQETGVGCAAHNDPACLCDVIINEPVEVECTSIQFQSIALQAVDAKTVSERNIYDFARYLLGGYERLKYLDSPAGKMREYRKAKKENKREASPKAVTPWMMLPKTVRDTMKQSFKAHVPWSVAKANLPDDLDSVSLKYIRTYYNQRLFAKNNQPTSV